MRPEGIVSDLPDATPVGHVVQSRELVSDDAGTTLVTVMPFRAGIWSMTCQQYTHELWESQKELH